MRKLDPILLLTVSDIFTNLSAGWLGAVFIVPAFSDKPLSFNIPVLIMDIILGIISCGIAFKIRKIKRK